jgi:hypothetical protein
MNFVKIGCENRYNPLIGGESWMMVIKSLALRKFKARLFVF